MASLRQLPNSKYWIACYYRADGSRAQRSTKQVDRNEAIRIAQHYEDAEKAGRDGRLTELQARRVIADIFARVNKEALPCATVRAFLEGWLKRKELEAGVKTHARYAIVVAKFLASLGSKADGDLSHVASREISTFRDNYAKQVSPSTVNTSLKILRAAFNQGKRDGLIDSNPAERVSLLKRRVEGKRRPFTVDELVRLLEAANDEWRGLILFGLYTGQRLGDLAQLTWSNINVERREVSFIASKTQRSQTTPLADALMALLGKLNASDDPDAPLFPNSSAAYKEAGHNGRMSKQFRQILVSAGLANKREKKSEPSESGGDRSVRHTQSALSFHCLRHTATSMLKNAGVSDAIARAVIGHSSAEVSKVYSHFDSSSLRRAVNSLPAIPGHD